MDIIYHQVTGVTELNGENFKMNKMKAGDKVVCINDNIQAHSAKADFCLPFATQLLHPKEMCLNASLNQIAAYLYANNQL